MLVDAGERGPFTLALNIPLDQEKKQARHSMAEREEGQAGRCPMSTRRTVPVPGALHCPSACFISSPQIFCQLSLVLYTHLKYAAKGILGNVVPAQLDTLQIHLR